MENTKNRRKRSVSGKRGAGRGIAYQNKDIVSKIFGECMKDRALSVYGINLPKVVEVLPTNLPSIEVNELRIDNIFKLVDGSYAIVDYESRYRKDNKLKYMGYALRTLRGLKRKKLLSDDVKLRIIIIYTADVKRGSTSSTLDCGAVRVVTEEAFLSDIDGDEEYHSIVMKINSIVSGSAGSEMLTQEDIMKLIILPLTYAGKEEKKTAVKNVIDTAKQIPDEETQVFAMAGILSFCDKIMDAKDAEELRGYITMTKVGRIIYREMMEYGEKVRKETAENVTDDAIRRIVDSCILTGRSRVDALEMVMISFAMKEDDAKQRVEQYWNSKA